MTALPIPAIIVSNNSCCCCCFGLKSPPPATSRATPSSNSRRNARLSVAERQPWPVPSIGWWGTRKGKFLVARAHQGVGYSGGGGSDGNSSSRVWGNLALAVGLAYLTMSGQLGWIRDAVLSISLVAVLLPIVGAGAFFWFAGRDIVEDSCPNCGNSFQMLKSSLEDGPQLCPFCTQPFSVQGDKFVRESARFSSNRTTEFRRSFNGFSPRSEKGKASSATVVDIEAQVRDID